MKSNIQNLRTRACDSESNDEISCDLVHTFWEDYWLDGYFVRMLQVHVRVEMIIRATDVRVYLQLKLTDIGYHVYISKISVTINTWSS